MTRTRRQHLVLLALLVLSAALFFFRLGAPGLFDADEPAYAEAAREMLRSGDWITPHFNGQLRFDKPALFYWLIAVSYSTLGVSELAVRVWSALAATGLTLLIAWTARRAFGPPTDLWAGLAFSTSLLTALLARAAVTDMLLTLFVTAAILAGLEAIQRPDEGGRAWARVAWMASALAVLVKGPVGLLIPGLALLPSLWFLGELRPGLRRLVPWEGPVLFAAVALPWYLLVLAANGWAFVQGFAIKHHFTRYVGTVSSHAGPLWFYVPVLLIGFFPWSAFLPLGLWRAWRTVRRSQPASSMTRLLTVCLSWSATLFLFFSLAGTKLPSYLFPAFPALALLVAACGMPGGPLDKAADEISPGSAPPGWLSRSATWLVALLGISLGATLLALPLFLERLRPLSRGVLDGVSIPWPVPVGMAAVLLVGTMLSLIVRDAFRPLALAGMMAALIFSTQVVVIPRVYALLQGPLRQFAEEARQVVPAGQPILVYGLNAPSIVFYADHPVRWLGVDDPAALDELTRLAASGRPGAVISRVSQAAELERIPGLVRRGMQGGYAFFVTARESAG